MRLLQAGKPAYIMHNMHEPGVTTEAQYTRTARGLVYELQQHAAAPKRTDFTFLPNVMRRRFVRHEFDIEGFKVNF